MARSYKKNPWISDSAYKKYAKRLSGKIMRQRTKERLSKEKYDVMPVPYECVNPYDICDYKSKIEIEYKYGYFIYAKDKMRLRK